MENGVHYLLGNHVETCVQHGTEEAPSADNEVSDGAECRQETRYD